MKIRTSSLGLPCFLLFLCSVNIFTQSIEKSAGAKLFDAGDYAGAVELLKKSNDLVDLNVLGYAYEKTGNEKEARNAFDRSFKAGYKEFSDGILKRASFDSKNPAPEDKLSTFLEKNSARIVVSGVSARKVLEMKGPSWKAADWHSRAQLFAEIGRILLADQMVYSIRELDLDAKVTKKPRPSYTNSARTEGVQGTVELLVLFDSDGKVKSSIVTRPLANGLTEEAYRVSNQIVFSPAQKSGKSVAVLKPISYSFSIY